MNLNGFMSFDHIVEIDEEGNYTTYTGDLYAPHIYDEELDDDKWELITHGYTGQHGYSGPIMHNSEFIGGRLERDILSEPGLYVALVAYYDNDDEETKEAEPTIMEGWAVAKYIG